VPTRQMRAIWHPTRAQIYEQLMAGPATHSQLAAAVGAPYAEVVYHCRTLHECGCVRYIESPDPGCDDILVELIF
jgi:hypothetical protein